jgi:putative protein-disulfide isomerase
MCSWCYGISNELADVWQSYPGLDKDVVLGGLRPGGGDAWTADFKDFLKHHWEDVNRASQMPFSYDLLDRDEYHYDTEPSCRAVTIVKEMAPDKAFAFFKAVQRGFYLESKDPKLVSFYEPICQDLGIDYSQFETRFTSSEARSATAIEFNKARSLGVNSFPTIILRDGDDMHVIAQGFATAKEMKAIIDQHMK